VQRPNLNGKKTIGIAILNAVLIRFSPEVREFAAEDPIAYGEILSLAMIGLRLITKNAINWRASWRRKS